MKKPLLILHGSFILLLVFILAGCAVARGPDLLPPSPIAPEPTATPVIEERTIEVEWPATMRLGDSDVIRLALFPTVRGYAAQLEFPEHSLELGEVEVPYLPGYQAQVIARMDAAGLDFEPRGDQMQTLRQGAPLSWRWTISPQNAGRQRLNLQIMLRWIPLVGEGSASEVTLWTDTLEIHVQAPLGLSAPQARVLGVAGMLIGGILVLPLAELTARQRLLRARVKRVRLLRPNPELRLEVAPSVELKHEEAALLRGLFERYARLIVESRYASGYSAACTLLVVPIRADGRADAHAIVKIGSRGIIQSEYGNYESFVRHTLPPITSRVLGPPGRVSKIEDVALQYTFVGTPGRAPVSLRSFALHRPAQESALLIEERLFSTFGPTWWMQRRPYVFRAGQEYDRLLPVHLELETVGMHQNARVVSGDPLQVKDLRRGDVVRIEGARVSEVRAQRRTATLTWPAFAGGSPLRIRYRDIQPESFAEEMKIHGLYGRVAASRLELLRGEVTKAFPSLDLESDRLSLGDRSLANPLKHFEDLLSGQLRGTRSVIHGDLNLENILVGPGDLVWLIDFACTREGHTLFDFARLEVELTTQVAAETLSRRKLRPDDFFIVLDRIHGTSDPLQAPLEEIAGLLNAVRHVARRCLYDPADISEFHKALILAYLGSLKFANLDEMPCAPTPKALAFLAAAYLMDLELRQ